MLKITALAENISENELLSADFGLSLYIEFGGKKILLDTASTGKCLENAKKLGAIQVKIAAKAGSNGKLFGSVTSKEISDALHEQFDLTIEKQKIVQAEPIKSFGAYEVKCKLGYEVTGTIHVLVIEEK